MKYTPTKEQAAILSAVQQDLSNSVLSIMARAGCTKTSTSRMIINVLKYKKVLYFAFNKAIVEEGASVFTSNVECKTLHALAYKYIRPGKVEDFTYLCIKEDLGYPVKLAIINAVDAFFRSSSTNMYKYLEDALEDEGLAQIGANYIELMLEEKIPMTFNFLLKYLHLQLVEGIINIEYDLVILDEAGDTTAVAIEIFKLISSPKKAMLGDDAQTIYGFMNLVNGFNLVNNPIQLELTKSFRCSTSIANRIEKFCKKNLDKNFIFKGHDRKPSDESKMYISATNGALVRRMHKLHQEGIPYKLLRSTKDIFACPLALVTAVSGKDVYHKRYKFLNVEYKNYTMSPYKSFFSYLMKEVDDEEIHTSIEALSSFANQNINIFDVYKEANNRIPGTDTIVCTAFTAKGLESDRVYIEEDLNRKILEIINSGGPQDDNDLTYVKLGYVAASRSRFYLDNCKYL